MNCGVKLCLPRYSLLSQFSQFRNYHGTFSCCSRKSRLKFCKYKRSDSSAGASILYRSIRQKVTSSSNISEQDSKLGPEKIRNVGIMAHIDAGKTTTTERFLYYSGEIQNPGEVHHGDTVTDFLPQERERGITIQSAVVTFNWKRHVINLIDTPGHVDFTFEVQRSLRVVDSAVAILDASAGVEAQTLTVWRQATDYLLPRLIYLNKMDKSSASSKMSLESISSKLKCTPLLLQLPFYDQQNKSLDKGSGISGIIDLVRMQRIIFDKASKGTKFIEVDVKDDNEFMSKRCELIEQASDFDSDLANKIIESESIESITNEELCTALRRITLSNRAVPVLLGSSYKNIGVQRLMDSILLYLPHPGETEIKDPVVSAYGNELCSFAFKTMHDKQLGPLTLLRIFNGTLHSGQKIYNATRGKQEKIAKVYRPLADDLKEISDAGPGQVVIVSGLKETVTGDTLSSSHSVCTSIAKRLKKKLKTNEDVKPILSGVHVPEPVFFCSIEPPSISQQKALDFALECLQREDPSLHVHVDPDTSQTVLSGMGELHLDIIHERIKSEFKVDADIGKLQVAYKETIASPISKRIVFERRLADQKHLVTIELELVPVEKGSSKLKFYRGRDTEKQENIALLNDKQVRCIQNGMDSAKRFGPKLSFPIIDIEVCLHWFETSRGTSETIVEAATASCFRQCLQDSYIYLLEPIVSLEVTVDEKYQRIVVDDLNRRRFLMDGIDHRNGINVISGTAPLSDLMGYSTILRTISSGLGAFSMQFKNYKIVNNPLEEEKIITSVRGF